MIRARLRECGGSWRPAAGYWPWFPIGAGMGAHGYDALRPRPTLCAPRSRSFCATPGSRQSDGRRRFTCHRSRAAGSSARRLPGSGRGDHFGTVRGRAYRRSDQAGLSRCSDPAREEPLVPSLSPALAPSPADRATSKACSGLTGGNRLSPKDHLILRHAARDAGIRLFRRPEPFQKPDSACADHR
jgi:hypothetical protein